MAGAEGEGVLICVAGPSGAGKDTLINAARDAFATDGRLAFPQRYISRAESGGEPHIPLDEEECERRRREGGFFLSWQAHGVTYGLDGAIAAALAAGKTVIVNISRQMIEEARRRWPRTYVIHVTVDAAILRERLEARGRESGAAVDARLQRAANVELAPAPWIFEHDNSGPVAASARRFIALIERLAQSRATAAVD